MTPNLLEALDVERIEADLAEKGATLAAKKEEMESLQATIARLIAYIKTLEGLLDAHYREVRDSTESSSSEEVSSDKLFYRHPMDMLHSAYKGMKLGDVATLVLSQHSQPLTTAELTHLIYETQTPEEFERARNSLSAELRSGAKGKPPRWRKIGRSAYAACSLSATALSTKK